jgi:hypothetical protein
VLSSSQRVHLEAPKESITIFFCLRNRTIPQPARWQFRHHCHSEKTYIYMSEVLHLSAMVLIHSKSAQHDTVFLVRSTVGLLGRLNPKQTPHISHTRYSNGTNAATISITHKFHPQYHPEYAQFKTTESKLVLNYVGSCLPISLCDESSY